MIGNPVNRLSALLGLIAIGVIAFGVASGNLDIVDAATRAGITLAAVIAVRAIGRVGISALAGSMERQIAEQPRRRATDQPGSTRK
jgi:hypothetical protein